jgi:peptidoglycan/LPS O-acetylase OafA/YrhL
MPNQEKRDSMTAPKFTQEARLTEIDGIRGILSIIVVLGHTAVALGVQAFSNMQIWYWMPMDVFFAISGFLLGRIVIANGHRPGFLRSYFIRRILRIWPAYYSVVLVVSAVTFIAADQAANWPVLAFIKQLTFLQFTEYLAFGERGNYLYALLHTWSVAIEEHFYLLLPLLVALLVRRPSSKVVVALLAIALTSVFLRLIGDMNAWVLLTRLHGFVFGLLVAFATFWAGSSPFWTRILRSRTLVVSFGLITLSWAFLSPLLPYELVPRLSVSRMRWVSQSLAAASAAAFLLVAAYHTNLDGGRGIGVLRNRMLTHLGEISYSTYLWHWPLFVAIKPWVLQSDLSGVARTLLAVTLVFIVANLSYYGVERPFLRLKRLWAYSPVGT